VLNKTTDRAFIFIAGPFGAGKSAFIAAVSDPGRTARTITRVVGGQRWRYDYGRITVADDLAVHLLAHPGARRFDVARELPPGTLGCVLLVSSVEPETFREARAMMTHCLSRCPVPFIVAASKQDHPDALSLPDVRAALMVPPEVPLVPCVATDGDSVRRVLIRLLHEVISRLGDETQ